jgi:hypothetical protein
MSTCCRVFMLHPDTLAYVVTIQTSKIQCFSNSDLAIIEKLIKFSQNHINTDSDFIKIFTQHLLRLLP